MLLVLDPGHGGERPGAVAASGLEEEDVALEVCQAAAAILRRQGHDVRLTRTGDYWLDADRQRDLLARCDLANELRAAVFVSIHCNAAANREAQGFEAWTSPGWTQADQLAAHILRRLAVALPGARNRGHREARFVVLTCTHMPAVLVEIGFLSNAEEAERLAQRLTLAWIAEAIAAGVLEWIAQQRS